MKTRPAWALAALLLAVAAVSNASDLVDLRSRVLAMYENYRVDSFAEVPDLSIAQARAKSDDGRVIWLDVRSPRERRVSAIPGAIDQDTFKKIYDPEHPQPVIVYCTIGYRSGLSTREFREAGIEAYNLAGGILAWIHDEGELVDPKTGDTTQRVHVFGSRWDLLPERWQGVW